MNIKKIEGFNDFYDQMKTVGFCLSGNNGEGIFSLETYYSEEIIYHTGDQELDPWAWRIRGVVEYDDLSYGKVFLNKAGWISKDWLTDFIAVRREGRSFEELYHDGLMTQMDKSVYALIEKNNKVSVSELNLEFGKEKKSAVAKAIVNLQMKLLITVCGETYKTSKKGEPYGWPVTVFSTIENRFGSQITEDASGLDPSEAYERISGHIKCLNPEASKKRIKAFIKRC